MAFLIGIIIGVVAGFSTMIFVEKPSTTDKQVSEITHKDSMSTDSTVIFNDELDK